MIVETAIAGGRSWEELARGAGDGPSDGEGFDDYALLYADEATIRTMSQNGKKVAMNLVHRLEDHTRKQGIPLCL